MAKIFGKNIHDRIKMVRIRLDLSQEQFARRLGISTSFYTKLEQGYANPGMKTLEKFYKAGVNVNFLLSGEPPMFLDEFKDCLRECGEKKILGK
jgi:transcriptional regulator with XRE-family HTH domain